MDDWLSFKTNHSSWFKENGAGCSSQRIHVNTTHNASQEVTKIEGCALQFEVFDL